MESCSLMQVFLLALEAGTTSQWPVFPPVSSLDVEQLVFQQMFQWDRS